MDDKVTEYIEKQKQPQKEICKKLRQIILNTFSDIDEKMKYGVPYYNNKYYIVALKEQVNLGFSIKNLNENEIKLFEGSGKTTRHIKIRSLDDINQKTIVKLLDLVNSKN